MELRKHKFLTVMSDDKQTMPMLVMGCG